MCTSNILYDYIKNTSTLNNIKVQIKHSEVRKYYFIPRKYQSDCLLWIRAEITQFRQLFLSPDLKSHQEVGNNVNIKVPKFQYLQVKCFIVKSGHEVTL